MTTPRTGALGVLSATGNMLFRDAAGNIEEVDTAAAANGDILTRVAGVPAWQAGGLAIDAFVAFVPDDAIFGAINGIADIAAIGVRNLRPQLLFTDDNDPNENIVFASVMPLTYVPANGLEVRIDWAAPAAIVVGDVKWNAAFERLDILSADIDAESFAAIQTTTNTTSGTIGQLTRTTIAFTNVQADGILLGEDFRLQIVRDAADGGDTLVGDASVLRVSIAEA